MRRQLIYLMVWAVVLGAAVTGQAEEKAARSVHLFYKGLPFPVQLATVEVIPQQVYRGTYLCLLGFNNGYAGIQELYDGKHVALFSVWDPGDPFDFKAHPGEVEESRRTLPLYSGHGVSISRFGGEGTGGKSTMPLEWKTGQPVRFAIGMRAYGPDRSAYTCWVWDPSMRQWFRMATFATLANPGKGRLAYVYSFIEDFLRNGESARQMRRAVFDNIFVFDGKQWISADSAKFTADGNSLQTIDAGAFRGGFWLQTGGNTANVTTRLQELSQLPGRFSPEDLYNAAALSSLLREFQAMLAELAPASGGK